MPNGYKKNLQPRVIGRKRAIGNESWVWCRCASCERGYARMVHGTHVPKIAKGGRKACQRYWRGYIRASGVLRNELGPRHRRKVKHMGLGKRVDHCDFNKLFY